MSVHFTRRPSVIESYKQLRLENLVTLNILDFVNINFDSDLGIAYDRGND